MFNIKSARFFQGTAENLMEQMINFCVFDTKHLMKNERAIEAPTFKWNQFFRTPWANSVEVKKGISFLLYNKHFQHEKKYEIFMNQARDLDIDERVGCLLQVVALFANDGAILHNHKQVSATQESFCHLLFR